MLRSKRTKVVLSILFFSVLVFFGIRSSERAEFLLGAAFIDIGYFLQDKAEDFDFKHHHKLTPQEVWETFLEQNHLASSVRKQFPLHSHHPIIAMLVCMDSRLDTHDISGDSRHYYYVIRTAGSVLSEKEEEMLELAIENGVKVVVFTTHSDCAAEKVAKDPAKRKRYPNIAQAVDERDKMIQTFLDRPFVKQKLNAGEIMVKKVKIDTITDEISL
jgi:carbonic anhydrase